MRTRKSMMIFIAENREQVDNIINTEMYRHDGKGGRGRIPDPPPTRNDKERREWIINHEPLYRWARAEGVNC